MGTLHPTPGTHPNTLGTPDIGCRGRDGARAPLRQLSNHTQHSIIPFGDVLDRPAQDQVLAHLWVLSSPPCLGFRVLNYTWDLIYTLDC